MTPAIPPKRLASARQGLVYALMDVKVAFDGIEDVQAAYAAFAQAMGLPPGTLRRLAVRSLAAAPASAVAARVDTEPVGSPFTIAPAHVVGEGNQRVLASTARSQFVLCLRDARVRSRSAFIEAGGELMLDFEGDELRRMEDQLELDPAVFRRDGEGVWIVPEPGETLHVEEAFHLLGPHTYAFGHWMWEYLPRFVTAALAGALHPMPVLIDEGMPASHRRSLELLLPEGFSIVELPRLSHAVVKRLWCAPGLMHMPLLEKMDHRFRWDYLAAPPARFAPVLRAMQRSVLRHVDASGDAPERLYFARKPTQHRKLVNHEAVEALVQAHGFRVVYPQDIGFDEQLRLVRGARFIAGPEGSAMFLAFFARPGTRVCILNHPYTDGLAVLTGLLEAIGVDVTVFTGPVETENALYRHFADYRIDPEAFGAFLAPWSGSPP